MGEIPCNVQDMSLSPRISRNILLVPFINHSGKPHFLFAYQYVVLTFNMTSKFWFHYLVLLNLTNPNHVLDSLPILETSFVTSYIGNGYLFVLDTTLLFHCFMVHQGSTCNAYMQIICILLVVCMFLYTHTRSLAHLVMQVIMHSTQLYLISF